MKLGFLGCLRRLEEMGGALLDSHSGEEALGLLYKIQESAEASGSQEHGDLEICMQEGHQRW